MPRGAKGESWKIAKVQENHIFSVEKSQGLAEEMPDTKCGREAHWEGVDWKYIHLIASGAASILARPDGRPGCMDDFAYVMHRASGLGGTEFLLKTPLIDTVLALHKHGVPLPADWNEWAPPGPGCRCALHAMRPRWRRQAPDGTPIDVDAYAHARSAAAAQYEAELTQFHNSFIAAKGHVGKGGVVVPPAAKYSQDAPKGHGGKGAAAVIHDAKSFEDDPKGHGEQGGATALVPPLVVGCGGREPPRYQCFLAGRRPAQGGRCVGAGAFRYQ